MNVGTYAVAQLLRVMPRMRMTRAVGRLCDLELPPSVSRTIVRLYVSAFGVDMGEALLPEGGFTSFDAFFTRALRPGSRPICSTDAVVSPSDGRLDVVGRVDENGLIEVKGRAYRASDLLCSESAAQRYLGGQFAVIYLSPRDYHRVHMPVSGEIVQVRSRPGDLFPVNVIGERHIPRLLVRNRRIAIVIETDAGQLTLVMVAAMFVGRISVTGFDGADVPFGDHVFGAPLRLEQGADLGAFHLGSTAVLFSERTEPRWERPLGRILLGQPLSSVTGAERPSRERGASG